jgi:hypothetical protein
MKIRGSFSTLVASGVALVASATSAAEDPRKLTCSASELFQCDAIFECLRVSSETINFPYFFIADVAAKSISGRRPDGSDLKTAVQQQTRDGDTLVLQGVESGRAWSLTVDSTSGKMSMAVAGRDVGFVGLGACLVE